MASHEIADKIALDQRERYILSPFRHSATALATAWRMRVTTLLAALPRGQAEIRNAMLWAF
jgi:hypothetical protein